MPAPSNYNGGNHLAKKRSRTTRRQEDGAIHPDTTPEEMAAAAGTDPEGITTPEAEMVRDTPMPEGKMWVFQARAHKMRVWFGGRVLKFNRGQYGTDDALEAAHLRKIRGVECIRAPKRGG